MGGGGGGERLKKGKTICFPNASNISVSQFPWLHYPCFLGKVKFVQFVHDRR